MGYSGGMTQTKAPDLTPGYPSNGEKLGPAWERVWSELSKASRRKDRFIDGRVLAETVAPEYDLAPATLVALLSRMGTAGHLDREYRPVISGRGKRNRTHYSIPQKAA